MKALLTRLVPLVLLSIFFASPVHLFWCTSFFFRGDFGCVKRADGDANLIYSRSIMLRYLGLAGATPGKKKSNRSKTDRPHSQ